MTDPTDELKKAIRRVEQSKKGLTFISSATLWDIVNYIRYLQTIRKNQEPHWTRKHFFRQCEARWPIGDVRPNLMQVIADINGWPTLEPGKQMSVHFGNEQYEIKRTR